MPAMYQQLHALKSLRDSSAFGLSPASVYKRWFFFLWLINCNFVVYKEMIIIFWLFNYLNFLCILFYSLCLTLIFFPTCVSLGHSSCKFCSCISMCSPGPVINEQSSLQVLWNYCIPSADFARFCYRFVVFCSISRASQHDGKSQDAWYVCQLFVKLWLALLNLILNENSAVTFF